MYHSWLLSGKKCGQRSKRLIVGNYEKIWIACLGIEVARKRQSNTRNPPSDKMISPARVHRIRCQGYDTKFTEEEVSMHSIGNRFAYQLCTILFASGLLLRSTPILGVAAAVAASAVFLPYHPFDYLFNLAVRHLFNRPRLPKRTPQARFACGVAAVWIVFIIICFQAQLFLWGYVLGGLLLPVALLVGIFDYCIPSMIYNFIFKITVAKR